MLLDRHRCRAIDLLDSLHLTAVVLGEDAGPHPSGRHLASVGGELDAPDYPAALAAWVLDRGDPDYPAVIERWRQHLVLSNADRDALGTILVLHQDVSQNWSRASVARRKRLAVEPWFPTAVALVAATSPGTALEIGRAVKELRAQGPLAPEPLVTGARLIEAGYSGGPHFSRVIDAVYDAQLENRISSLDEAMALAHELISVSGR